MSKSSETHNKLIEEISVLKRRIKELEQSEAERKQVEEERWESDERLNKLYQESPISTFTWQKKGNDFILVDFNRAAVQITNGKVSNSLGQSAAELWKNRPEILGDMERCFLERSVINRELTSQSFAPGKHLSVQYGFILPDLIIVHTNDLTDLKRAEEAVRESEIRYRLLAENARDVIWTVDMDMRMTYVSPSVERLLGFTAEETMTRTMREAFTQASFEKAMVIFSEELAIEKSGYGDSARSRILELDLVRKDGNTVPVEGNFCFLHDSAGKPTGILSIVRDTTERRKTEEALLKSEKRFRSLFHNIHLIGLVIDPSDGSIVDANPGALSFYGWSRDELLGMKIAEINTLSSEDIFKEMDAALKEQRSYFLFQHRRADGSVRDVEVYSGPIQTGTRELLYSIIHDITERKMAEEEVRLTLSQLRTFMDAINESAFLIDKEWRILAANKTVAKRFGKTVQELVGFRIEDVFPPDIIQKRRRYLEEVIATGKSVHFEDERLGRTISNVLYPVLNRKGEVLALAIIGYDVTDRKKVEEALEEERKQLLKALDEVRTLRGILPICANCKKIRDDKGYWNQVENYVSDHTEAKFSHGICPECSKILYRELNKHSTV